MSVIIDFQGIHARHLTMFRQYARTKEKALRPIFQAQARISSIKHNTVRASRASAEGRTFLAPEFIGGSVNMLI